MDDKTNCIFRTMVEIIPLLYFLLLDSKGFSPWRIRREERTMIIKRVITTGPHTTRIIPIVIFGAMFGRSMTNFSASSNN
jgi:hypothetical protein